MKNNDELIVKLDKMEQEAITYRRKYDQTARECERAYEGKIWKVDEDKKVKNWIFALLHTELPVILSQVPGVDVIPSQDDMKEDAEVLDHCIDWVLDNQNAELKQMQSVLNALKTGCGYWYIDFDPDLNNGEGSITISVLPRESVLLDPTCTGPHDASFAIFRMSIRKEDLQRKWNLSDKEMEDLQADTFDTISQIDDSNFLEDDRVNYRGGNYDDRDKYSSDDIVVLKEYWVKDYTMVKIDEEETTKEILLETEEFNQGKNPEISKHMDHKTHLESHYAFKDEYLNNFFIEASKQLNVNPQDLTENDKNELLSAFPDVQIVLEMINDHIKIHENLKNNPDAGKKPKYKDFIKLIIRVGNTILADTEPDLPSIPLVPFWCYKEDGPYAKGEVENIIAIQKSYAEMDNAEYEALRLCSNPGWIKTEAANIVSTMLNNAPGLVITEAVPGSVRRLDPGTVSPQLAVRMQRDFDALQRIPGVTDAVVGEVPSGITAARALKQMAMQFSSRQSLKVRMLWSYSMKRAGELIAKRIVRYWSTERQLRIYDANGALKTVTFKPENMANLSYEIKVTKGSLAGEDKENLYLIYRDMLTTKIITPQMFVDMADVPNKTKIMQELAQRDQLTNAVQQLQVENEQLKTMLIATEDSVNKDLESGAASQGPSQSLQPNSGMPPA